jgi:RNA polymerase sigma factor (sigma-70 family)
MAERDIADDLVELVLRARAGDNSAWALLVKRFRGLLASIARSYRLANSDVEDVVQTTWVRLYESIDRLRQPESLPGWLTTTARRESLRLLRMSTRETLTEEMAFLPDRSGHLPGPGEELLQSEEHAVLWSAVEQLPPTHRRLLTTLMTAPSPAYADVARELDMPVGSIGPTRARGIDRLRRNPEIAALAV